MTRLLAIMGSGETAPTMAKVHRSLIERAGGGAAVLLDTPYGFQENADDISARAQEYFRESVGHPISVASWRSRDDENVVRETALARIAEASYVFAGPGSPTYALRQWAGTPLPDLLASKLARQGVVTFASAAAVTIGVSSVPVYEVYKVGETPEWREGLDLLGPLGLRAAVIPHFDNAEGGTHDTRYCYLGERRLRALEADLADDAFVLGVDEHTCLVIDADASSAEVIGHGTVTVRREGRATTFREGCRLSLDQLRAAGLSPGSGTAAPPVDRARSDERPQEVGATSLLAEAELAEQRFDEAVAQRDASGAVSAILDLERAILDWSRDTFQSDEADRARAVLRRLVVRLGELAATGARDPRDVVGPFVEAVLGARREVRGEGRYELADRLRDALVDAGIEVRDTPSGTDWSLMKE